MSSRAPRIHRLAAGVRAPPRNLFPPDQCADHCHEARGYNKHFNQSHHRRAYSQKLRCITVRVSGPGLGEVAALPTSSRITTRNAMNTTARTVCSCTRTVRALRDDLPRLRWQVTRSGLSSDLDLRRLVGTALAPGVLAPPTPALLDEKRAEHGDDRKRIFNDRHQTPSGGAKRNAASLRRTFETPAKRVVHRLRCSTAVSH